MTRNRTINNRDPTTLRNRDHAHTIHFDLPHASYIELQISDLGGRKVRRLHEGVLDKGPHWQLWDGRDDLGHPVSSGVYFLVLDWSGHRQVERLTLLR